MMRPKSSGLLLFGVFNAALYSALLPLWGGFDEPFHYSYIETLWRTRTFPLLGRTFTHADVEESLKLAPASAVVHRLIPQTTSYDDWFVLPESEKLRRRRELDALRPGPESGGLNYEAQHPPLAYLILAFLDRAISDSRLRYRVMSLRLLGAIAAVILIFAGARQLCSTLGVPEPFTSCALFTIFSTQMLYATIAHVANDWLAAGLAALFFAALAAFASKPNMASAMKVAAILAAGLLAKAYFLVFLGVFAASAAWMIWRGQLPIRAALASATLVVLIAGPWYARNVMLYRSIASTYEEYRGIGPRATLAAAASVDWLAAAGFVARGAIWTGDNAFTTFSRATINGMLVLIALGLGAWAVQRRAQLPERIAFAGVALFVAALAYQSAASYANNQGRAPGAAPWYTQPVLMPVIVLAYLGFSRWKPGRYAAILAVAIWT